MNEPSSIWTIPTAAQLADALLIIDDASTMKNFLEDVLTQKEITEMSARLEAARLLQAGTNYIQIAKSTKLSSRTIARISAWLQNGAGGYTAVLNLLNIHHSHISPASTD